MPEIVKPAEGEETPSNFIQDYIVEDLKAGGQFEGKQVHTRFPPEPNGYLHIGHAKAVCIDFGTAEKFGGICNLRMDDTNPTKEDVEYVDAIKEDIHWLGFDWDDRFYYASEYFEKMYEFACRLIEKGLAYVCELTPEQMRENQNESRGVRGRKNDAAGQNRFGLRQFQYARPGYLPDQPGQAPSHRRYLVHLSYV